MPPESDTVLSGATRSPCPDSSGSPAPVPPSAPGSLPLIRLHELLDQVASTYAWYFRLFPRAQWAKQPDPIAACQWLAETDRQLEAMEEAIEEARRHVALLFDLSFDESVRRRSYR